MKRCKGDTPFTKDKDCTHVPFFFFNFSLYLLTKNKKCGTICMLLLYSAKKKLFVTGFSQLVTSIFFEVGPYM